MDFLGINMDFYNYVIDFRVSEDYNGYIKRFRGVESMRTSVVWDGRDDIPYRTDNDNYLYINSCSLDNYRLQQADDFYLDRKRDDWYLLYFTGGSATVTFDENKYKIGKGDIVLYEPGCAQLLHRRREDDSSNCYVHFGGYAVREMLSDCGLTKSGVYNIGDDPLVRDSFNHLIAAFTLGNDTSYVNYLFTKILMHIGAHRKEAENRVPLTESYDTKVLMGLMRLDWEAERTVRAGMKKYADISGYGTSQFARSFKNTTGKTPAKYIIESKIEKAKEIILTTSIPMNQVAALCGYNDPLYFSRIFKKRVGVSPREYRKNRGLKQL